MAADVDSMHDDDAGSAEAGTGSPTAMERRNAKAEREMMKDDSTIGKRSVSLGLSRLE